MNRVSWMSFILMQITFWVTFSLMLKYKKEVATLREQLQECQAGKWNNGFR